MRLKFNYLLPFLALATFTSCDDIDLVIVPEPTLFTVQPFAQNLTLPIGMSFDGQGRAWVTESGTGKNDARVSLITPDGKVYPAFTGFTSVIANGAVEGIGHVLYHEGILHILDGGAGKLYSVDVTAFKPGDAPQTAQTLIGEDIGSFVRAQMLTNPINTNLYNLTLGPNDNLYINDSGANAIIKRDSKTKALSVFAKLPNIAATVEAVPTGIVYDGKQFYVSTLSGFPFTPGAAKIYRVDLAGNVSDYKTGFTTLTDIALSANDKPIVIQYVSRFSLMPPTIGFLPNTGQVVNSAGTPLLIDNLDRPTDIERVNDRTYYVLSTGDGTLKKLTF
ncbi:MAG TPA: ScyD/ScyE family protein [Hymenobacter sp.]|jgi:hypothetical protein